MLKLKGYLKPFIVSLLIAVALLAIQAVSELNLPNYMSNIVNVGIQQGGVEDSSPQALSSDAYAFIQTFMDNDDVALMNRNYTLVASTDADKAGTPYLDTYPASASKGLYVLNSDITPGDREQLDAAFGTATWTMVNVFKDIQARQEDGTLQEVISQEAQDRMSRGETVDLESLQNLEQNDALANLTSNASDSGDGSSDAAGTGENATATNIQEIDFAQAYQLQPLLDLLPRSIFDDAREQALGMDSALREQSGTMLVAGFYRELGVNMQDYEISYITRIGILMLIITVISGVATVLVSFLSARIGAGVARNLRRDIFSKVSQFGHAEFDRFSTASLITRSTNDVSQMQLVLNMGIRLICYAPIMGVGATFMAVNKSVSMSWIIGVGVLFLVCMIVVLIIIVMPKFKIIQMLIDKLNLVARETLNGLMVIRAFGRNDFEQGRFEAANDNVTKTNLFIQRAMTFLMPVMMLFMNGLSILIIWVGAHQVAESQMQVGDMMAYMQYAMQVVMSFMFIAMMFIFIPRASVSAVRIAEVLEVKPSIVDPVSPVAIDPAHKGRVEFRDVSFRFEGAEQNALCNISFVAHPGKTTAFIGSTGSGKSTILNLIPRFYDVTEGEVLVDGVNVKDAAQHELRSHIGYVPQKSVLMGGTIASNITYGNPSMTLEDREKVTEVAQALDFVNEKEEGFDFEIAQGGTNVSGGQRQRLSIARALAVHPSIFLFDDSFSALDFKTDAALRHALAKYTKESTLIIVAQRVSTIMDADHIYVIDDGVIAGHGTHRELLASCPAYLEIASSQLNEEELKGGGE